MATSLFIFDPVKLMMIVLNLLDDCEKDEKIHFVKGYPVIFITDFGLKEAFCGLKAPFSALETFLKKNHYQKMGVLMLPIRDKLVFESYAYFSAV